MPKLSERSHRNIATAKQISFDLKKNKELTEGDIAEIMNRSRIWVRKAISDISTGKVDNKNIQC